MQKTIKLSNEDVTKLGQYESSIAHWSNEYTVLSLRTKKTLDAIDSLYTARQKTLDEFMRANGIDPLDVENVNLTSTGDVNVSFKNKSDAPAE